MDPVQAGETVHHLDYPLDVAGVRISLMALLAHHSLGVQCQELPKIHL